MSTHTASGELQGIARFTFDEGNVEEFKRLSARCLEIARTRTPGTLQYDVYLRTVPLDDEGLTVR